MDNSATFQCLLVHGRGADAIRGGLTSETIGNLPPGDTLIRVAYSSLNYKDALAARGHPGIVRRFPHVPGIDAVGEVVSTQRSDLAQGQSVIVTGYELGAERWGGWSEFIRVPGEWVVPLPEGLSKRQAMILGTAGFTAAQCVAAIIGNEIEPSTGPIVVTGATGGVGCLAVIILASLGYSVTAVTGKNDRHLWLRGLGAKDVVGRAAILDESNKPLLHANWAGAVDTVGGNMLTSLLRSMQHRGCVTACGLVGGTDLPLTVYPFLLRGVRLIGIDSALCPYDKRIEMWRRLATVWKPADLESLCTEVTLAELSDHVDKILQGNQHGRVIVRIAQPPELAK